MAPRCRSDSRRWRRPRRAPPRAADALGEPAIVEMAARRNAAQRRPYLTLEHGAAHGHLHGVDGIDPTVEIRCQAAARLQAAVAGRKATASLPYCRPNSLCMRLSSRPNRRRAAVRASVSTSITPMGVFRRSSKKMGGHGADFHSGKEQGPNRRRQAARPRGQDRHSQQNIGSAPDSCSRFRTSVSAGQHGPKTARTPSRTGVSMAA